MRLSSIRYSVNPIATSLRRASGRTEALGVLMVGFHPQPSLGEEDVFGSCFAKWDEHSITVRNAHIERSWTLQNEGLVPTSFIDRTTGTEWITHPESANPPVDRCLKVTAGRARSTPVAEESLDIHLQIAGNDSWKCHMQVFPEASGITLQFTGSTHPNDGQSPRSSTPSSIGIETDHSSGRYISSDHKVEEMALVPKHLKLTEVSLLDQTEIRNELVFEKEWLLHPSEGTVSIHGNLFHLEDPLTHRGLVFLKLAPLLHARTVRIDADATITAATRKLSITADGYPFVMLAYPRPSP